MPTFIKRFLDETPMHWRIMYAILVVFVCTVTSLLVWTTATEPFRP